MQTKHQSTEEETSEKPTESRTTIIKEHSEICINEHRRTERDDQKVQIDTKDREKTKLQRVQ